MDLKTIVITWMDGPVVAYDNATANVLNGVLNIYLYKLHALTRILDRAWHFPLTNIRAWGPEEWEGQNGVLLTYNSDPRGTAPGPQLLPDDRPHA